MCKAAKVTIAEVEEVVEVGEIDPDDVQVSNCDNLFFVADGESK
jgi:acyl CoA:acetate/3-ketoacid CoA transferase alpha subunit